jgi:hypothetical protein
MSTSIRYENAESADGNDYGNDGDDIDYGDDNMEDTFNSYSLDYAVRGISATSAGVGDHSQGLSPHSPLVPKNSFLHLIKSTSPQSAEAAVSQSQSQRAFEQDLKTLKDSPSKLSVLGTNPHFAIHLIHTHTYIPIH